MGGYNIGFMSKKKRVLIISPSNIGTIPRRSLELFEAMKSRENVEVKLVHIHHYSNGFSEYEQSAWHEGKSSFMLSLLGGASRVCWLKKIKKKFKPDLTISMLAGCSSISVLSRGQDTKIGIFRSPISQIKGFRLQYFIAKASYRFLYPKLDYLFCISKEIENYIKNTFPWIPSEKLSVVYNVFDFDKITGLGGETLPEEERAIFLDEKVLLSVGRVEPIKAPERLVEAFFKSSLPQEGYRLVFIGEDVYDTMSKSKKKVKEQSHPESVYFLGKKQNPYLYMKHSAAIVSASRSEGLPGVLIESLIVGKPVVATNSSRGIWEILSWDDKYDPQLREIVHTKDGIITPNTDDESLNIGQLALALDEIVGERYRKIAPAFIQKVRGENIVDEYLNCIR